MNSKWFHLPDERRGLDRSTQSSRVNEHEELLGKKNWRGTVRARPCLQTGNLSEGLIDGPSFQSLPPGDVSLH